MDQAEQLRNIIKQRRQPKANAKVITVTSGKGGVGKSSISVNIAIQLSKLGQRVIILDADFGLANVEVMLGIRPRYNLADLMFRGKDLQDIITRGPENIGFISGGSGIQELTNISKDQIVYLTQKLFELNEIADYIIIDTGAGINDSVLEFVVASSEVLLVTTPEPTSITDAYALLKAVNRNPQFLKEHTSIKMISNRVSTMEEGKELYNKLNTVVSKFLNIPLEFMGSIPQDNHVPKAVMQQKPFSLLYPNTISSKAIIEIAELMSKITPNTNNNVNGIAHLFTNLLKARLRR
ncbi:MAG: Cobyrinic acid ac-diamide synthase [Anaerocolumna sp.]|jgi:flagellar biosynthesis protein FlhG|nr:Cobyrinic acid ac-diamide synthase [Anaerocolumna sp.]